MEASSSHAHHPLSVWTILTANSTFTVREEDSSIDMATGLSFLGFLFGVISQDKISNNIWQ